jgi:hypothetical protein
MAPRARKTRGTPRQPRPRTAPAAAVPRGRATEPAPPAVLARLREALQALERALRTLDERD